MFEHLNDNPKWCAVALEDLLHIVEKDADYGDYCRILRYTKQYIQETDPAQVEDDEDQLLKLHTDVIKAFLAYTQHCELLYHKKLDNEQSSSNDEDEVPPKETKEDIKKTYTPEPFPEHLIAIQLNS